MARKKIDRSPNEDPRYHNTWRLLKAYRDVVWSMDVSVSQLKNEFQVEYGSSIEEFLDSVYLAGADLNGTDIEQYARSIERSNKMLTLVRNAVELLRTRHKNGEVLYWILYYTYLSPQELGNVEGIIEHLRPHVKDIGHTTYFRKREQAVRVLSSVLWGYTSRDNKDLLETFFPSDAGSVDGGNQAI